MVRGATVAVTNVATSVQRVVVSNAPAFTPRRACCPEKHRRSAGFAGAARRHSAHDG